MLLLEQNITKKKWANKNIIELDFEIDNSKKYKLKVIKNSTVYEKT